MTEFENILNEANKKNGNEQVAVEAPAEKEKKSYGDLQREKKQQCYSMIGDACVDVVSNGDRLRAFLDVLKGILSITIFLSLRRNPQQQS